MYTKFFNLRVKPFELVPNPAFLYQSRSHKKALNYLKYGLHEQAGFILLTGEVGSGKTTIVRNIINEMEQDVALSMLFNTKVSNKQVLAMINEDFGLSVSGKDKIALLRNLNDFLVNIHAQKRRAVVIIDEAQNLSASALEEIRLLSNLEATTTKLLQIVLVGQPELKMTIARHELRQLRQRISVHAQIDPLTRSETEDYVYHRLKMAGNRDALSWGEGTFDELYKYSRGIPRLINVFCDFILLAACVENTTELTIELVQDVISDVSWDKHVAEYVANDQSSPDNQPRQGIMERFLVALAAHRDEINCEIKNQNELLNRILEIQDRRFRRLESGLERTYHQLQIHLTSVAANKVTELDNPGSEKFDGEELKGLLSKLFS